MIATKTLEVHVSRELLMTVEEVHARADGGKRPFDSFIRERCLAKIFQRPEPNLPSIAEDFNAFVKAGRKWLYEGEPLDIDVTDFPASFLAFTDTKHTDFETETLKVAFSDKMHSRFVDYAAFENARLAAVMRKKPNIRVALYSTVGDWFKEIVLIPTFVKEGLEEERNDLLDEAKALDKQEETLKKDQAAATVER